MENKKVYGNPDIIYRCNYCNMIIGTESTVENIDKDLYNQISDNLKIASNKEFIFFIKTKEELSQEKTESNLYEINNKNRKLLCKTCKYEIGYYNNVRGKTFLTVGILLIDKINSEELLFPKRVDNSNIQISAKFLLENISLLKQFRQINELVSSYTKDYYRNEIKELTDGLDRIKYKLIKIEEIINENEI